MPQSLAQFDSRYYLLGWHWEFLPSFAAKLIPGVDLVPLWTLAVANVYRKSRAQVHRQQRRREPAPLRKQRTKPLSQNLDPPAGPLLANAVS